MGHNQLDVFYEKYQDNLNQPIVESFLKEDKNYFLFKNAIIDPTEENKQRLDLVFKQHYKQVKMISYISKLIYFYSIDFDKKISLTNQRQLLNLDTPISTEENNTTSKLDVLTSSKEDLTYLEFENIQKDIQEYISNDNLFASLNLLSDKQLKILKLLYIVNYNNKEVAELLGESEQTVSYNHKKAIEKLRKSMNFKK
jgi:RNA polymerase sigma factor (sigma-70 family)